MTRRRSFLPAVLLVLSWAGNLEAQVLGTSWVSPCTLDVWLVTFKDTTARHPGNSALGDAADQFDYYLYDRPHDYDLRNGRLEPGDSSYTMDDFKRLFSGGYPYSVPGEAPEDVPAFTATGQVVAREDDSDTVTETLPSSAA